MITRQSGSHRFFAVPMLSIGLVSALWTILSTLQCANNVLPERKPFPITVTGDSLIMIRDSLRLRVSVPDAAVRPVKYLWFVDVPLRVDTTVDSTRTMVFAIADTGRHCIVIQAIDYRGAESMGDSFNVYIRWFRPTIMLHAPPVIGCSDTLHVIAEVKDSGGVAKTFFWSVDGLWLVTGTGSLAWVFNDKSENVHTIRAAVIDDNGSMSDTDSVRVDIFRSRPTITLHAPPVIGCNDTLRVIAEVKDSGGVAKTFLWSVDGFQFMTGTGSLAWIFNDKSENVHTIRASVIDDNGSMSDTGSVSVAVKLDRPMVSIMPKDTAVFAYQSLRVKAMVPDSTKGAIAEYRWMVDGRRAAIPPLTDTVTLQWGGEAAGVHRLSVIVVKNDSLQSLPDTMLIAVQRGGPMVAPLRDTTLPSEDTLTIGCSAADPNGTISRFLWNFSGGPGWNDSTVDPRRTLTYSGKGTVKVIVGARDNNGLVGADTFIVTFNRPPDSIVVTSPSPCDTLVISGKSSGAAVSFAYAASDSDNDSITYKLLWGTAGDSLVSVYQGSSRSAQVTGIVPGRYLWQVIARDGWGHSRTVGGSMVVLREYRICFVGHSIVVGFGGSDIMGGFRGGVLDSLRSTLGPWERLKSVGPVESGFMSRSIYDDSCLALNGAIGSEVYRSLSTVATQLTGDIWVLMTGVNDVYNPTGLLYTIKLMDLMYSRVPDSRIYVLNGLKRPSDYNVSYWLPSYNQGLTDTIAARRAAGVNIFMVNADSAISNNGQFDSTKFNSDQLHPNQAGYDLLAQGIVGTMRSSDPAVIPKNH